MIQPESSTSPARPHRTETTHLAIASALAFLCRLNAVSLGTSKSSCLEFRISLLCTLLIPIHLSKLNSSVGPSELPKWSVILSPLHLVPCAYFGSGIYHSFAIFCGLVSFLLNVSCLWARNMSLPSLYPQ